MDIYLIFILMLVKDSLEIYNYYQQSDLPYAPINNDFKHHAVCPPEKLSCPTPLDYAQTKALECTGDCPSNYLCCPDTCFQHRICKAVESAGPARVPGFLYEVPNCPRKQFQCTVLFNVQDTKQFSCQRYSCPQGYMCCSDRCFYHKICKKVENNMAAVSTIFTRPQDIKTTNVPIVHSSAIGESEEGCPPGKLSCSTPLNFEQTKNMICFDNQCPVGYRCCTDSCFKHRVCKMAVSSTTQSTVTATTSVQTSSAISTTINLYNTAPNVSTTSSSKDTVTASTFTSTPVHKYSVRVSEVCPVDQMLCPASIEFSQGNKYICKENSCPQGYKCCADSCFTHRICKKSDLLLESVVPVCPSDEGLCVTLTDKKPTNVTFCQNNQCPQGLICCSDSCFKDNICKTPYTTIMTLPLISPTSPSMIVTPGASDNLQTTMASLTEKLYNQKENTNRVMAFTNTTTPISNRDMLKSGLGTNEITTKADLFVTGTPVEEYEGKGNGAKASKKKEFKPEQSEKELVTNEIGTEKSITETSKMKIFKSEKPNTGKSNRGYRDRANIRHIKQTTKIISFRD